MRIAFFACFLAPTWSACSETTAPGSGHSGEPFLQRIELAPASAVENAAGPTVVASFGPDDESVRWEPIAPTTGVEHVVTDAEGSSFEALVLDGTEFKRIEIHGSFDPTTFDRIRIVSLQDYRMSARITLERRGGVRTMSQTLRVPGQETASSADFDFPGLWQETEPFDRLSILFRCEWQRVCLLRCELVRLPPESRLPSPAGPAELVRIGEQWRSAKSVLATVPLDATFDVPARSTLAFSYGLPEEVRARETRPRLRVEVQTEGGRSIEREYALESDPDVPTAWHAGSMPLDELAGERVRARFSAGGGAHVVLAVGEPAIVASAVAVDPPTVVLVTSDTHRGDHIGGARNGAGVSTPFLDALAERGILFDDCWTSANSTQPSHAALLTGSSPLETGVVSNYECLSDEAPTLPEAFRAAGYLTWAAVSVGHLGPQRSGLGQGFDRVSAPQRGQRDSRQTIAELSSWLPDADGLPLFVWLHVFDAHSPYEVPEAYERLYYPAAVDPRGADLPALKGPRRPYWDETIRDVGWVLAQYKSQITYLDEQLGLLFENPRMAGAIVAVTADHGESLGAHGVHYSHAELYPDSLHVPLVLAWPGSPGGSRVEHPVEQIDVGRTLLDLAGLGERPFPGRDLTRLLAEPAVEPRFALSSDAISASVQAGRWLLILNLVDRSRVPRVQRALHAVELYDLAADPGCTVDVSATESEQARQLRSMLVDWLAGAPTEHWRDDRVALEEEIEELAELGYASEGGEERSGRWFDPDCDCESCADFE